MKASHGAASPPNNAKKYLPTQFSVISTRLDGQNNGMGLGGPPMGPPSQGGENPISLRDKNNGTIYPNAGGWGRVVPNFYKSM